MKGIALDVLIGFLTNLFTNYLWDRIKKPPLPVSVPDTSLPKATRWLVVSGWGILPLGYTVTAVYLLENRWPLTMGESLWLIAGGFFANLLVVAIGLKISLSRLGVWWSLALISIVIAIEAGTFYLLDRGLPNYVSMNCPSSIEDVTTVEGRVINPQWRIYVLIKPRSVDWGDFKGPSYPGKDGTWYVRCDFGGRMEEKYEIYAVAIPPDRFVQEPTSPQWLATNAPYKTSFCVVNKR